MRSRQGARRPGRRGGKPRRSERLRRGPLDDAIAIFDRKENSGEIGQATGTGGCYADNGGSCADGRGLNAVAAMAVSPDSSAVYAVSFLSDAVAIFNRAVRPYDIDGDGQVEALTDALLMLRLLFGFTGPTLVGGAVDLLELHAL